MISESKVIVPIDGQLESLAAILGITGNSARGYLNDLRMNGGLLFGLNTKAAKEPSFGETRFNKTSDFRAWREAMYIAVRTIRPVVVMETGVHHGFSSALILQALADNGGGKLFSVDMDPESEGYILEPSLRAIPNGKKPGWIVPDGLRDRWELFLLPSRAFMESWDGLPGLNGHGIDIFIHDSDHSPDNVRAEIEWAWPRINPGGLLVVDNAERGMAAHQSWTSYSIINVSSPDEAKWETMFIRKG